MAIGTGPVGQTDPFQELPDARVALGFGYAAQRERQADGLGCRHVRRQRPPVMLFDHADPETSMLVELGVAGVGQFTTEHGQPPG